WLLVSACARRPPCPGQSPFRPPGTPPQQAGSLPQPGGGPPGSGPRPQRLPQPWLDVRPRRPRRWLVLLLRGGCADRNQRRGQRSQLLVVRRASDDPQERPLLVVLRTALLAGHSGMFPCFLGGSDSRFSRSIRSARAT